mgnify:CR=1 FL=1
MSRKLAALVAGLALLALAVPGLAQSGPNGGPNGGLIAGTGHHKTELVVGQTDLTVYLLEDGKPHESKGTTMRAVIQQAGKTTTLKTIMAVLRARETAGTIKLVPRK